MKKRSISQSTRIKHVVLMFIVVFQASFAGLLLMAPQPVSAASYSDKLKNTYEPSLTSGEEVGIWVDRNLIYLYLNSASNPADHGGAFYTDVDGINQGTIVYKNSDGCELSVTFSRPNSTPSEGTLAKCSGVSSDVRLTNKNNAFFDGYLYGNSGSKTVFMPRYISGVGSCNARNGEYSSDGTFEQDGNEYILTSNSKTKVYNVTSSGDIATAKQNNTKSCTFGNATLNYAGGSSGGRTIYLLKGYTRDEVKQAVKDKINDFLNRKTRQKSLTDYFNASAAGRQALAECKQGAGISGSQSDLIALLADVGANAGNNPFVDCMLRKLDSDSDFQQALNYTYDGNFDEVHQQNSSACSSGIGIPIIGDVVCGFVQLIFNVINSAFSTVINYFGNTADTFGRFSKDPDIKNIWSGLKNLASILFLIAFLIVVFQYLTNINVVDAYFVKKFIPRLVIAIVLVQASFWLVSEMNFIASDLGKSIQSLLLNSATGGGTISIEPSTSIAAGVSVFAIFGGPAAPAIALIIGLILALVLLLAVIILVVRELLLVVLAVLAPLALATIAIPQLESTSKKWFSSYIKLLAMYPIMMLFISVGAIIGNMLTNLGGFYGVMGFIAYFLPFLVLPFSFKMAGGIGAKVAGTINGLSKKGVKMGYGKGKEAYGNSQLGLRRAKEKEMKRGIKADRAGNAASDRLVRKMQNNGQPLSPYSRMRTFGAGATNTEVDKYRGVFEQKEKKRKREEADLAVASQIAGAHNYDETVDTLDQVYRDAMARGDNYTADAAYSQLVGNKATGKLEQIQEDANNGTWGPSGTTFYNKQQGDNFGDLSTFAPHVRGDVGGVDLNKVRADNLAGLSNDQIASVKPEAWAAWAKVDPVAATRRFKEINDLGGGAAAKLSPDAIGKMLAQAGHSDTPSSFNAAVGSFGGIDKVTTDDLRKSYDALTKKINDPANSGLNTNELASARASATKILNELQSRP